MISFLDILVLTVQLGIIHKAITSPLWQCHRVPVECIKVVLLAACLSAFLTAGWVLFQIRASGVGDCCESEYLGYTFERALMLLHSCTVYFILRILSKRWITQKRRYINTRHELQC